MNRSIQQRVSSGIGLAALVTVCLFSTAPSKAAEPREQLRQPEDRIERRLGEFCEHCYLRLFHYTIRCDVIRYNSQPGDRNAKRGKIPWGL